MKFPTLDKKKIALLLSLIIGIFSLLYYLSYYKYFKIDVDEGLLINGAMRVLSGEIPLKDFHQYTPGRFYLLALWFLIFGKSVAIERLLFIFLHCIKNILVFNISRKIIPLPFNLIPVILLILVPGFWVKAFVNLILLINLYFIHRYLVNSKIINLYLLGLSTGFSFYFREDLAGYSLITVGLLLIILGISKKKKIKTILKEGTNFTLAVILALLPLILFYWINDGIPELGEGIYQTIKLGHVESWAFQSPSVFFKWPIKITDRNLGLAFPYFSILLFLVIGLILLLRFLKKRSNKQSHNWLILSTLILAIFSFTHIWHWTHEFRIPQSGALIHVLWAYLIYTVFHNLVLMMKKKKKTNLIKIPSLILVFLASAGIQVFLIIYSFSSHNMVQYDAGGISLRQGVHQKIEGTDRAKISPPKRQAVIYSKILEYIEKNTSPNDRILCFGQSPLYFLSNRKNATEFDNGRIPAYFPKQRRKFLRQIRENKPKLIIVRGWEHRFWYPKMPEVFEEIHLNYFWERKIYDFLIFYHVEKSNKFARQGNYFHWKGEIEKATEEYLEAINVDRKHPTVQKILTKLFFNKNTSQKSLPILDGYCLKKTKNSWMLRWGSKKKRKFSGKIYIQNLESIKEIITDIEAFPKNRKLIKTKFLRDAIYFESEISNNSASLDLKFAESHPAISIVFDLKLDDAMNTERALIPGKGLISITYPFVLRKAKQ